MNLSLCISNLLTIRDEIWLQVIFYDLIPWACPRAQTCYNKDQVMQYDSGMLCATFNRIHCHKIISKQVEEIAEGAQYIPFCRTFLYFIFSPVLFGPPVLELLSWQQVLKPKPANMHHYWQLVDQDQDILQWTTKSHFRWKCLSEIYYESVDRILILHENMQVIVKPYTYTWSNIKQNKSLWIKKEPNHMLFEKIINIKMWFLTLKLNCKKMKVIYANEAAF